MANHKRKKSRRHVRCVLCTGGRDGNSLSHNTGKRSSVVRNKRTREDAFKEAMDDLFRAEE